MECKMAPAILAQGNRLEHSRAVLRLTSEDKKVAATCTAQLTKCCIASLFGHVGGALQRHSFDRFSIAERGV